MIFWIRFISEYNATLNNDPIKYGYSSGKEDNSLIFKQCKSNNTEIAIS